MPREGAAGDQPVVLSAQGLVKRFGGITATQNVSLDLRRGARHALIGPNGAGKTTLINLLTGVLEPTEGRIVLEGQDITQLAPPSRSTSCSTRSRRCRRWR
jgi:branched-chain amino acid transport system ATP-binding protein